MPLQIISDHAGEIHLSSITPTMLWEYKLPETQRLVGSGPYGNFLLQEMTGSGYRIWYNIYQLHRHDTITVTDDQPGIRIPFILRNSFLYQAKGLGDWLMHERGYHIYYTPQLHTRLQFRQNKMYTSFELCVEQGLLEPLAPHYPALAALLDCASRGETAALGKDPVVATPAMIAIIRNILNNTHTGPLRQRYLDTKVSELVLLAVHQAVHYTPPPFIKLSEEEVEMIYETKALLLNELDKSYSIEQMGRKRGLTVHKLKKGFLRIYGTGIFDFLLEARMERAGALLQETHMPVEHVARLTGYKNIANFSVVFKKYYGYPPRYFRGK